jgi:replicative DNA helicase
MSAALDPRPATGPAQLPSNMEAEAALLGCLLYDNGAFERLDDGLRAGHFFEPFHQRLFDVIETKIRKGQLAEPILIAGEFGQDRAFDELGGILYLANLVDHAPPAASAHDYGRLIHDLFLDRELIRIAHESVASVTDGEHDSARERIEAAEGKLFTLAENRGGSGFVTFAEALHGAVMMAAEAHSRDGGLSGVSTGLIDLDQKLGGMHPSDLMILAARPSMGKAQPLTSKVLMRDGTWRAMGDLRLGDELASTDGAPSRVAGIFPQGERQVYRVTLGDGRSTVACAEHLWAVNSSKIDGGSGVVSTARLAEMMRTVRFHRRVSLPLASGHFGAGDASLLIVAGLVNIAFDVARNYAWEPQPDGDRAPTVISQDRARPRRRRGLLLAGDVRRAAGHAPAGRGLRRLRRPAAQGRDRRQRVRPGPRRRPRDPGRPALHRRHRRARLPSWPPGRGG